MSNATAAKRVYPVAPQIVEVPVGMRVALLERVVRAHALLDGNDVRLLSGEVIGFAGNRSPHVSSR